MMINVELKGKFTPPQLKEVQNIVRSAGAISSQVRLNQTNEGMTISIDSDKRHHFRSKMQEIVAKLHPTKVIENGRITQAGELLK